MLTKLAQKWLRYKQERLRKKQLATIEKEKIIVYQNYQMLLKFIEIMNKRVLINRQQKKAFWSRVQHGEPLVEEWIQKAMKAYAPKAEVKEEGKEETKETEQNK